MNNAVTVSKKSKGINSRTGEVKEFLKIIPKKSGVYIFKDSNGKIIYIGKAKNLYSRVRSYFQSRSKEFPRVFLTRDRNIAGAKYFGPYTDAQAARRTIKYLRRIFLVRDCMKARPGKGANVPCLNYYIKLCTAPCTGNITREEYHKNIEFIILFLSGKDR